MSLRDALLSAIRWLFYIASMICVTYALKFLSDEFAVRVTLGLSLFWGFIVVEYLGHKSIRDYDREGVKHYIILYAGLLMIAAFLVGFGIALMYADIQRWQVIG